MKKFECFDEGDFWGIRLGGQDVDAEECQKYVRDLQMALQKVLDDSNIGVVPRSHLDRIQKLLNT